MTNRIVRTAFAVFLVLVGLCDASAGSMLNGRVISVADGDTLTLLDAYNSQHRVRLAEIDAPEAGQPFGHRSKLLLTQLCLGEQAQVYSTSPDSWGRVVGTVHCNGIDANAEMVRQGLAWVYVQFADPDSPLFALERLAREAQIGLWSDPDPVGPWFWRRGERGGSTPASSQSARAASGDGTEVRGNRNSMIYHLPHCPSFDAVSPRNRVVFPSERQAQVAGFRRAHNC